jgi:hypothetical protein
MISGLWKYESSEIADPDRPLYRARRFSVPKPEGILLVGRRDGCKVVSHAAPRASSIPALLFYGLGYACDMSQTRMLFSLGKGWLYLSNYAEVGLKSTGFPTWDNRSHIS